MQQRKSTFSILFFIKRKKLLKNGDAPVYMRVTVDGRFLEASLKRGVNPKIWNEKKQRSTGRDRLSLELNNYLDDTLAKILKIHQRFADEKKIINPKTILDYWSGRTEKAEGIPFSAIDNAFVHDLHLFLRVDKKQEQNTANNHCKILK